MVTTLKIVEMLIRATAGPGSPWTLSENKTTIPATGQAAINTVVNNGMPVIPISWRTTIAKYGNNKLRNKMTNQRRLSSVARLSLTSAKLFPITIMDRGVLTELTYLIALLAIVGSCSEVTKISSPTTMAMIFGLKTICLRLSRRLPCCPVKRVIP